ncbi:MAG: hypothetical protein CVU06_01220 [Bacteroidetes bacterium HGW-Bacteroidetes-22]|nr:MAG: hypothetical protein CVU06_01220 [Bacteroidetes bacterium HGW-Bacteroidetes-22]
MKTSIFTLFATFMLSFTGMTQDYDADLQSLLPRIGSAKTGADYALVASQLNSLAQSEPGRWEASFWSAHCMVLQAFSENETGEVDPILDQAEIILDKLIASNPDEAEFYVLMAMLDQARISVNPMTRGMKYSGLANDNINKAMKLDPDNPRAWYLKASNVLYTPMMFGGGKEKAKPIFETAAQKFDSYKIRSPYHPDWGKEQNAAKIKECGLD